MTKPMHMGTPSPARQFGPSVISQYPAMRRGLYFSWSGLLTFFTLRRI